ncbi:MFS general substrate transporter [Pseudovirgaria hyperparasitica]|uniref:MFS general substrate transporter n=1 Tax=Pseudovirgaria hyperparasitica TaxID=470096 RepID=A0A6A6VZH5_9PEZI|nr:MFS general substrate transporter [Pseudovirgaria hyperparasitica]KAF2755256.1 MFS general substrate transporter [Pseudovirgaria hyperparasitica]
MASHELELTNSGFLVNPTKTRPVATRASSSSNNSHSATSREKDLEKLDQQDRTAFPDDLGTPSEKNDIEYHYLEFDTPLPDPDDSDKLMRGLSAPPEPPDLKRFVSPYTWPTARKRFIIIVSVIATGAAAFSAGSYAPGVAQMSQEWGISEVAALVGITIFTCGFGVAPMVLAPFSEINGRKPVFLATGVLFIVCQACCAATQSYGGMLAARFLVGVGGSTFSTMVGGIVSDIYSAKDRNTPMALFSGAALLGTGLGPLTCGYIAEYTTWRWIFGMQAILDAIIVGVVAVTFRETRGSVLLSRRAARLNKYYEAREAAGYDTMAMVLAPEKPEVKTPRRIRWKVRADEERVSLLQMIKISLVRPFHLLFTEPVIFWFSLWVSFSWAILYLTLAAVPLVTETTYNFSLSQANSVFAAMVIGSIIAAVGSIYQEQCSKQNGIARFLTSQSKSPERRLFFCCAESLFMVVGLFMFGWTAMPNIHWIAPSIAIAFATIGIFSIYLAVFNYLADAYVQYASSALAAQSFCRNLLGALQKPMNKHRQ